MADTRENGEEKREFELPIRLSIGEREVEVPIRVSVTFETLAQMVERHLFEQEDLYLQLMEHYAEQAARRGKKPTSGRSAATRRAAEGPSAEGPAAPRGAAPAAANGDSFSEAELEAWRGKAEPPFSGRGRKSRDRRLWEAANPDRAASAGT